MPPIVDIYPLTANPQVISALTEILIEVVAGGGSVSFTVTLLLDCPQNQPHRAEIAKLMTRMTHRGQGIARLLMQAAETIAINRGLTGTIIYWKRLGQ